MAEEVALSEQYLSDSFAKVARAQGWPDEVVSQITIKYDRENITFDYPPGLDEIIFELEYGGPQRKPSPAIRIWSADLDKPLTEDMAGVLLDTVLSKESGF